MPTKKFHKMYAQTKLQRGIVFALLIAGAAGLGAESEAVTEARRFLGLQFGSVSSPLGSSDPFAFPLGAGFFFEVHPQLGDTRLCWGASALYYGFRSLDADFTDSFMVQAGLFAGFDIPVTIDGDMAAALTPCVGFKQYYREYRFLGERIIGHRGMAVAGARLALLVAGVMLIGFDVEYNLLFEEERMDTAAWYHRLGVGF
jgi:hypothetical protein